MTDTMTFHKLIVLYMLSRVDFPLTRNQIGDFLTEREYTQYLALQQAIGELLDAGFVAAESARNRTHLTITPEGRQTLSFLAISFTIPSGRTLTNTFGKIISGCATRFPSGPITRRPPPASTALIWWQRTGETP